MESPRYGMPSVSPRQPHTPRLTREPFNRAMWLERYTLRREAEFVEKGATELMGIERLISPRYRGKNNMTYESCVTAMYAKKAGGEMWKDWNEAQDARLTTKEFAMTHRVAPRANMPLLRIAHSPRAQSARGARGDEDVPAIRALTDHFSNRAMGRPSPRSAPRRNQREAAISAFRAAPPLDERKLRQWELQQEAEDEHAPATQIEMHAALKLIRARLVRRGLADADRIRRHLRRCDEGKGYMSKRTTMEDTYAVLNTLALRGIRKAVWEALINKFHYKPGEVGDKDYCVKYDELCDYLMDGTAIARFGDLGGAARPPGS